MPTIREFKDTVNRETEFYGAYPRYLFCKLFEVLLRDISRVRVEDL